MLKDNEKLETEKKNTFYRRKKMLIGLWEFIKVRRDLKVLRELTKIHINYLLKRCSC